MEYLMLDQMDITKVVGEITSDELMEELHFKNRCSFESWLSYKGIYKGCVIVEKYDTPDKSEIQTKLIYEKKGRKYFINSNCKIYVIYKSGSKRYLSIYQKKNKPGKYFCKISDHEIDVVRTLAINFLGMKKEQNCMIKGKLELSNIKVMDERECRRITGKMAKVNKPVGYFIDGRCVKKFHSTRDAGKFLFMSYQTVSDYCNHRTHNRLLDLRWI